MFETEDAQYGGECTIDELLPEKEFVDSMIAITKMSGVNNIPNSLCPAKMMLIGQKAMCVVFSEAFNEDTPANIETRRVARTLLENAIALLEGLEQQHTINSASAVSGQKLH